MHPAENTLIIEKPLFKPLKRFQLRQKWFLPFLLPHAMTTKCHAQNETGIGPIHPEENILTIKKPLFKPLKRF